MSNKKAPSAVQGVGGVSSENGAQQQYTALEKVVLAFEKRMKALERENAELHAEVKRLKRQQADLYDWSQEVAPHPERWCG